MRSLRYTVFLVLGCLGAGPSQAQDAPPLCSDRPGKATPTCTTEAGTFQIETSIADWTRDRDGGTQTDTLLFADTLLKYGVGPRTEIRASVTPSIHDRTRTPGGVSVVDGFGDIGLSVRHQVASGDGGGIALALQPYVVLPVGSNGVSAGTLSAGVVAPVSISLPGSWSLAASPTVAASADSDGDGRHLFVSGVVALGRDLGGGVTGTAELYVAHDRDPGGHSTPVTADLLLAWQPADDWQLDVSSYVGLNDDAPGIEVLAGFTRRFR